MSSHEPQRRLLVAAYTVFAIAAGARASVQLATKADHAPLAYGLSAVSALIYLVGGLALRRASEPARCLAGRLAVVEFAGVLAVGTLSLLWPAGFPDASVWSGYGIGYGFVPAVLPLLALWWLRTSSTRASRPHLPVGTVVR